VSTFVQSANMVFREEDIGRQNIEKVDNLAGPAVRLYYSILAWRKRAVKWLHAGMSGTCALDPLKICIGFGLVDDILPDSRSVQ
jgi:hypothetical protein